MSADPQPYQLSLEESQRRFRERIVPRYLAHGIPQRQPVLVMVAGQPGAGKTVLENQVHAILGGGTVTIDADDLRPVHPDYLPLAMQNDRIAAPATQPDVTRWVDMAKDYCIGKQFNVIFSTTMRGAGAAERDIVRFRRGGYPVEVVVLAVHEATSRLGVLSRYQQGREDVGFGRYVPDGFQRDAYAGLLSALEHIDQRRLADRVSVYLRDGTELYANQRDATGEWQRAPAARAALEAGRQRPWSLEEIAQFRHRAGELAHQLPQDLQGDLLSITEAARDHVAAHPWPGLARPRTAAAAFPHSTRTAHGTAGQAGRPDPATPAPGLRAKPHREARGR
jgi:UDP-N-acetylglucosamine kinase